MSKDHGRFIWCELMTPDVASATRFYGAVVGWTAHELPDPDGDYTRVEADGYGVGGMMALTAEAASEGVPPNWTGYIAADDVDAAVAKVTGLGGAVMRPPQDIPGIGRFAVVADPFGAVFAMMTPAPMDQQPPQAPPSALGHTAWRELAGGPPEPAFAFYAEMFGWTKSTAHDMGPMGIYQLFNNQDGEVGGMMAKPPEMPGAGWAYYFRVGDIGAAARRVADAGGQILNGPMEVPGGDWVLQGLDPQGAMFSLLGTQAA